MSDLTADSIVEASVRQSELLLYDYFKHMTTLALVTLGGMLTISQSLDAPVPLRELAPAVALISLGGVLSLHGLDAIIKARFRDRALPRWLHWYRALVGGSFGIGTGLFLGLVWKVIG